MVRPKPIYNSGVCSQFLHSHLISGVISSACDYNSVIIHTWKKGLTGLYLSIFIIGACTIELRLCTVVEKLYIAVYIVVYIAVC